MSLSLGIANTLSQVWTWHSSARVDDDSAEMWQPNFVYRSRLTPELGPDHKLWLEKRLLLSRDSCDKLTLVFKQSTELVCHIRIKRKICGVLRSKTLKENQHLKIPPPLGPRLSVACHDYHKIKNNLNTCNHTGPISPLQGLYHAVPILAYSYSTRVPPPPPPMIPPRRVRVLYEYRRLAADLMTVREIWCTVRTWGWWHRFNNKCQFSSVLRSVISSQFRSVQFSSQFRSVQFSSVQFSNRSSTELRTVHVIPGFVQFTVQSPAAFLILLLYMLLLLLRRYDTIQLADLSNPELWQYTRYEYSTSTIYEYEYSTSTSTVLVRVRVQYFSSLHIRAATCLPSVVRVLYWVRV
jgi:hypothetical protein